MSNKKLILLLHGYYADGNAHFLPHLKKMLGDYGEVHSPDLPNSKNPTLKEWKQHIKKIVRGRTVDLVVGHSLGGVVIMSMITTGEIEVKNLVTIGSSPGWKDVEQLNDFITPPISFKKLKKHLKHMVVVHSYDDPHCAFEYGTILIKQAGAAGIFYGDKKHYSIKKLPDNIVTIIKSFVS